MEEDIFIRVYKENFRYVYRYLFSLTFDGQRAEDLTQEVFIKAFCILDSPRESIKAWLLTVAHNLYVDYVRKNKRLEFPSDDVLSQYPVRGVENVVEEKESIARVFSSFKALPEAQRQAVLLCLVNELSYEEASKIMGLSVSGVTNLIYRARKNLRALRRNEE